MQARDVVARVFEIDIDPLALAFRGGQQRMGVEKREGPGLDAEQLQNVPIGQVKPHAPQQREGREPQQRGHRNDEPIAEQTRRRCRGKARIDAGANHDRATLARPL